MKNLPLILTILLFHFKSSAQYVEVFSDEFDGTTLNTDKWFPNLPWGSQQYWNADGSYNATHYDAEHILINNGICSLIAEKKPYKNWDGNIFPFVSGAITSNLGFNNGIFAIRFKMPPVKSGFWPAFWVQGEEGEIDCFEMGNKSEYFLLWTTKERAYDAFIGMAWEKKGWAQWANVNKDWGADWHTMAIKWDPNTIYWYVDGKWVAQKDHTYLHNMRIIANLYVPNVDRCGFDNPGSTPDQNNATFPAYFQIDWIRAWKGIGCDEDRDLPCLVSKIDQKAENIITGHDINLSGQNGCGVLVRNEDGAVPRWGNDYLAVYATNEITMNPGFEVHDGAEFHAEIIDCPENGNPYKWRRIINPQSDLEQSDPPIENKKEVTFQSEKSISLEVFPNPTSGIFNLITKNLPPNAVVNFEVVDILGHNCLTGSFKGNSNSSLQIDLSKFRSGVYFVRTQIDNMLYYNKVVRL